eukprot:1232915-Amphidinium_carterae.1
MRGSGWHLKPENLPLGRGPVEELGKQASMEGCDGAKHCSTSPACFSEAHPKASKKDCFVNRVNPSFGRRCKKLR